MAMDVREEPGYRKHRMIERWVSRRLGSVDHERRVHRIATTLFDLTAPLHSLSAFHKRLLQYAAMVHDVGRCKSDEDHPEIGARMIERTWLPLTPAERRSLIYLTQYHKGSVPQHGQDGILTSQDDRRGLRLVLALLRAADGLDGRAIQSPRLVFAFRNKRLKVTCYLDQDCAKARKVYSRRKKFRLLEDSFDCRVEVDIHVADGLKVVA